MSVLGKNKIKGCFVFSFITKQELFLFTRTVVDKYICKKEVSKTVKIGINQTFCVTATKASFWKVEDKKKENTN